MNPIYSTAEKVILGLFIIILFFIGIYTIIFLPSFSSPALFSRERNFFLIDINKATDVELCLIPYISPNIARQIIQYRNEVGRIRDINELLKIKGIGGHKLNRLKNYLKKIGN